VVHGCGWHGAMQRCRNAEADAVFRERYPDEPAATNSTGHVAERVPPTPQGWDLDPYLRCGPARPEDARKLCNSLTTPSSHLHGLASRCDGDASARCGQPGNCARICPSPMPRGVNPGLPDTLDHWTTGRRDPTHPCRRAVMVKSGYSNSKNKLPNPCCLCCKQPITHHPHPSRRWVSAQSARPVSR